MNFKIKIHNIGRLHKAKISVRPLTVLAGPNNTGKSFFSKSLYSLLDAMSANPLLILINFFLKDLLQFLQDIELYNHFLISRSVSSENKKSSSSDKKDQASLKTEYKNIEQQIHKAEKSVKQLLKSFRFLNLYPSAGMFGSHPEMADNLSKTLEIYRPLLPYFENLLKPETEKKQDLKTKKQKQIKKDVQPNKKIIDSFKKMKSSLKFLEDIKPIVRDEKIFLEDIKPVIGDEKMLYDTLLAKAFGLVFKESLISNFQIPNVKKLKQDEKALAFIEMESKGRITIEEDNNISADLSLLKSLSHQQSSRVLYIESPFFWKFRKALDKAARQRFIFSDRWRQSLLTPKYFNDLSLFLLEELSGDPAFPEVLESINQTVKGKLVLNETGGLIFKESGGKSHSLPMTATGIVQMSVLALLIEKKILDKGSILFIDEPETNLHPAWQVKMMEILFQLVREGVQIVMATHSVDIMKWIETHLKQNPEDEALIALNQLTLNKQGFAETPEPDREIFEKIQSVKKNLTDPFLNLFLKGKE